jgi:adenine-specific DNA-methyltransferase
VRLVRALPGVRRVADVFSGSARVAHALKRAGLYVLANDHNAYAHVLAGCYVAADLGRVEREARLLLGELNRLPGRAGFVTATYCEQARFFQPKNGERIDAIRDAIERKALGPELRAVVLTSLLEAADRVDSTCGLQMAYLKAWAPRSYNDLELRLPDCLPGPGEAHRFDALEAAECLEADVAYLDPPYNQHSYLRNYHIWETLVLWDAPSVYGVARKRADCRDRTSAFNSRRAAAGALAALVDRVRARHLVVSFNDEGYLDRAEIAAILRRRGPVSVVEFDHRRYVGARIGIYNPSGVRVGRVSHVRNRERLFVVGDGALDLSLDGARLTPLPEADAAGGAPASGERPASAAGELALLPDGAPEPGEELDPRYGHAPERGEVRGHQLRVEEGVAGAVQRLEEAGEGDLGRVGVAVEHRLAGEHGADAEPV